jgi:hypothetical protein
MVVLMMAMMAGRVPLTNLTQDKGDKIPLAEDVIG